MSSDWSIYLLSDITENFDSKRIPVKELERTPGPFPYYGASGVVDFVDKYLFDGEFVLVAEDGENLRTRKTPVAFLVNGQFWVNNHAHIIRGNAKADTRFLSYVLENTDISGYLTGSTIPKLTQANLNRIPVLVPPISEQRAIANILGALDDKIELNRRTNETLEEIARTLFISWFVRFDPVRAKAEGRPSVGMDAETAALFPDSFVDSELGEIPAGWQVKTLSEVAEVVGGSTPSTKEPRFWDGDIPFTTPRDMSKLSAPIVLSAERSITQDGLREIPSGRLPVGTVLMSSRAPIGYLAISYVETAVNQGMIGCVCNKEVPNTFVYLWLRANMETIIGHANGTTFLEISRRNFRPLKIITPSSEVLRAFAKVVGPMFEAVASNEIQSRTIAGTRDVLLPKLISGEIRLDQVNRGAA